MISISVHTINDSYSSIHHPPKPATNSPIIIFLRREIPFESTLDSSAEQLALGDNATAVEIKYPLSASSPYPLPIHSVCDLLYFCEFATIKLIRSIGSSRL